MVVNVHTADTLEDGRREELSEDPAKVDERSTVNRRSQDELAEVNARKSGNSQEKSEGGGSDFGSVGAGQGLEDTPGKSTERLSDEKHWERAREEGDENESAM